MSVEDGIGNAKIEQAKRLNWILGLELYDPELHSDMFERFNTPDLFWEAITPGVKQMTLDKIDFIYGDDDALDEERHPHRNVSDKDWRRHRLAHENPGG